MNTTILRSGRELQGPQMPMREERREVDNEEDNDKAPIETPSEGSTLKGPRRFTRSMFNLQ